MKKKYAIHPNYVPEQPYLFDYSIPNITYEELIKCYGIKKEECINWSEKYYWKYSFYEKELIHLHFRPNGDYNAHLIASILTH